MTAVPSRRLDAEHVHAALVENVPHVLELSGIEYRGRGELRTQHCPACGPRSGLHVCISADTGRWMCHAHGCKGNIFSLVAGYAGLDVRTEFRRVLELGASMVGIDGTEPDYERERRIADRRRVSAARQRAEAEQRALLVAGMPKVFASLLTHHRRGERYLAGRELDPDALRARGDVFRFSPDGELALPLRDLTTGEIVGIQYRATRGVRGFRSETGSQLADSALHGRVVDLDPDGVDVAVLVEGIADTLAAILMWPGCAVFGAPAGQLARVAAAVAPRVLECRGWLLLAADDDDAGVEGATAAAVAAVRAGLALAPADTDLDGPPSVRLVPLGEHHDLADAYRAGWRWQWPSSSKGRR